MSGFMRCMRVRARRGHAGGFNSFSDWVITAGNTECVHPMRDDREKRRVKKRHLQDSNLRGQSPADF